MGLFRRNYYDPYEDLLAMQKRLYDEYGFDANHARTVIEGAIIYCTVGKDRKKLTPEFVDKYEAMAREGIERIR